MALKIDDTAPLKYLKRPGAKLKLIVLVISAELTIDGSLCVKQLICGSISIICGSIR